MKMKTIFFFEILNIETNINNKDFEEIKKNVKNYLEDDKKYRLNQEIVDNKKFKIREFIKKFIGFKNSNIIKCSFVKIFKKPLIKKIVFSSNNYKLNKEETKLIQKIYEIY